MRQPKLIIAAIFLISPIAAHAGLITVDGSLNALTDISEMYGSLFVADHNDGVNNGLIALDQYSDQGMTMVTGLLTDALAGVTTPGSASQVRYSSDFLSFFPGPVAGGGDAGDW